MRAGLPRVSTRRKDGYQQDALLAQTLSRLTCSTLNARQPATLGPSGGSCCCVPLPHMLLLLLLLPLLGGGDARQPFIRGRPLCSRHSLGLRSLAPAGAQGLDVDLQGRVAKGPAVAWPVGYGGHSPARQGWRDKKTAGPICLDGKARSLQGLAHQASP
jgi:hypothetical protein